MITDPKNNVDRAVFNHIITIFLFHYIKVLMFCHSCVYNPCPRNKLSHNIGKAVE